MSEWPTLETAPMALVEMIEGYRDGRDGSSPEPSSNRSRSYRHGFANGRDDLSGTPRASAHELREIADYCIAMDEAAAPSVLGR